MIPDNIVFELLKNAPVKGIMKLSRLSKQFYNVYTSEYLWKLLCYRDINLQNDYLYDLLYNGTYYNYYKKWYILRRLQIKLGHTGHGILFTSLMDYLDVPPDIETDIPNLIEDICEMPKLKKLRITGKGLTELSVSIGKLSTLTDLNINYNKLNSLPEEIGQLTKLEQLHAYCNNITEIPTQLSKLVNITDISLCYNKIIHFPKELCQLSNLLYIDMSSNKITEIPKEIGMLTSLKQMIVDNNLLTDLPEELYMLPNLEKLHLYDNKITYVSPNIKHLTMLKELDLRGNELTEIPKEIKELSNLYMLRYGNNKIKVIPDELSTSSEFFTVVTLTTHYNRYQRV